MSDKEIKKRIAEMHNKTVNGKHKEFYTEHPEFFEGHVVEGQDELFEGFSYISPIYVNKEEFENFVAHIESPSEKNEGLEKLFSQCEEFLVTEEEELGLTKVAEHVLKAEFEKEEV